MSDVLDPGIQAAVVQRLDTAWHQLAGNELHFLQEPRLDAATTSGMYALTPIHLVSEKITGGIALNMTKGAATQLAASMFGESIDKIDDAMRNDVCAELSNILCSCITPMFGEQEEIALGVTMSVLQADFQNIFTHNEIKCIFQANSPDGSINLVVVDSFAPKATPTAPAPELVLPTTKEETTSMKFLIVDDSRAIQSIVRRAVEKTGLPNLEFKTASNGAEALMATESWLPDMVITDWHMPGMTGIELIKELKRKHADLKVGFVTTESSSKNLDEAKLYGAAFVLHKPFADDELVQAILGTLGTSPGATNANATATDSAATMRSCDKDSLATFFSSSLSMPIDLNALPARALESIQSPWAIGLYAHAGKNDVCGFCLLDRNAILLLGGARSKQDREAILAGLQKGEVAQSIYEKAAELLSSGANVMFHIGNGSKVALARNQLVPHAPEKLIEIMNKSTQRSDYSLAHSGLPAGHITIITR
ncbi:MAG TPA: response regulator [Rhodocyclaceae bacterium]|nr:response regulator [Rhodocyclaceae bacterium]